MISILTTHYNRPYALVSCLEAIKDAKLDFDYEVVISDDGSDKETIAIISKLEIDTLVLATKNEGLAANLNKGIKACQGDYILYVQEDFLIQKDFSKVFFEGLHLLDSGVLDMVRYRANYRFNFLLPCSENIWIIPKFSFRNFNINTFRYSDHPFLTTPGFFERFGYYLERTSGGYGETEYAIRIMKSKARIGITSKNYFDENSGAISTMYTMPFESKTGLKKYIWRFARALRQHLEWILYHPKRRKLYTYKNKRVSL